MENIYALFGGGGTGGHVIPALAVAEELVGRGVERDMIRFVGSARGIDETLVGQRSFGFDGLSGRGIQRSMRPRAFLANIRSTVGLVGGIFTGIRLVQRYRPQIVVSMGGYASFATSIGAIVWRVPLVLMEQNAKAGAANRAVRWFSMASATSFSNTDLPRQVVTGNPVRAEILAVDRHRDRAIARQTLGLRSDSFVVAVACGSLGARRVNTAIYALAELWAARTDVEIYHVIGRRDFAATNAEQTRSASGDLSYHAVEFESRMALLYSSADVIVGRAGGTTMAEIAVIGVPAIAVPLPIAPRDHQRANAVAMGGGVVLVDDGDCTAHRLAEVLTELQKTPGLLAKMSTESQAKGHVDAAAKVADLLAQCARTDRS